MEDVLKRAMAGDINAFQQLFEEFQPQLRSFIYRLVTNRADAEDLTHDTFVRAFDKIETFKGTSSLKTWVFRIGTNLAKDFLRRRQRWPENAQDLAKDLAMGSEDIQRAFWMAHTTSPAGQYEIREHIDFCFTCIGKTLVIEQQVTLILKDIYQFSVAEISRILDRSSGVVKHLLIDARKTMSHIFSKRCALINKEGTCHQCTELAGIYNPKQAKQQELLQIDLVKGSKKFDREQLYQIRAELVRQIDPLRAAGSDWHEEVMHCTRLAIGEVV